MTAHGYVSGTDGSVAAWPELREQVLAVPGVVAAAPYVQMEGMIRSGRTLKGVLVNGVLPAEEAAVSGATINFVEGNLDVLQPGSNSIILGRLLALDLGARIGDGDRPADSRDLSAAGELEPVLQRFVLRGVFEAGVQDHDASLALIHLHDAQQLLSMGARVSGVRFVAADVMAAPRVSASLQTRLGDAFTGSDWTIENASYFRAIRLEKMMMSLILSLIIGVAAFNIVASLVMVVTDKTGDIAILRTLGMGPGGVVRIFFIQGAVIGWIGVFLGVVSGTLLAIYVPVIAPVIERVFGFQIMPGDVYYVSTIPSVLRVPDVVLIAVAAFLLTSLATLYPARRAAHVNPASALRYE